MKVLKINDSMKISCNCQSKLVQWKNNRDVIISKNVIVFSAVSAQLASMDCTYEQAKTRNC